MVSGDTSQSQTITGLRIPLHRDSDLWRDVCFSARFANTGCQESTYEAAEGGEDPGQYNLPVLLRAFTGDPALQLKMTKSAVSNCLMRTLGLTEPPDTNRLISMYGIDSLAAIEIRNCLRSKFNVWLSSMEILSAASLAAVCDQIISKVSVDRNAGWAKTGTVTPLIRHPSCILEAVLSFRVNFIIL